MHSKINHVLATYNLATRMIQKTHKMSQEKDKLQNAAYFSNLRILMNKNLVEKIFNLPLLDICRKITNINCTRKSSTHCHCLQDVQMLLTAGENTC